jgi:hypothetical protein
MKVLRIESKGYVWHVPADVVAKNRVAYYEGIGRAEPDEYEASMDNGELYDWFLDNMNWEDVVKAAFLVQTPELMTKPDSDEWDVEVISVPS